MIDKSGLLVGAHPHRATCTRYRYTRMRWFPFRQVPLVCGTRAGSRWRRIDTHCMRWTMIPDVLNPIKSIKSNPIQLVDGDVQWWGANHRCFDQLTSCSVCPAVVSGQCMLATHLQLFDPLMFRTTIKATSAASWSVIHIHVRPISVDVVYLLHLYAYQYIRNLYTLLIRVLWYI